LFEPINNPSWFVRKQLKTPEQVKALGKITYRYAQSEARFRRLVGNNPAQNLIDVLNFVSKPSSITETYASYYLEPFQSWEKVEPTRNYYHKKSHCELVPNWLLKKEKRLAKQLIRHIDIEDYKRELYLNIGLMIEKLSSQPGLLKYAKNKSELLEKHGQYRYSIQRWCIKCLTPRVKAVGEGYKCLECGKKWGSN